MTDLHPGARATSQLFPECAAGFDPALDTEYAYDPAKAKQLLAAAGYPNGFVVRHDGAADSPTTDQIAIQEQWQEIGVKLNFITATSTDALLRRRPAPTRCSSGPFAVGRQPPASSPASSTADS